MHYLKFKKEQVGKCNICGIVSQLNWHHAPPIGEPVEFSVCLRCNYD